MGNEVSGGEFGGGEADDQPVNTGGDNRGGEHQEVPPDDQDRNTTDTPTEDKAADEEIAEPAEDEPDPDAGEAAQDPPAGLTAEAEKSDPDLGPGDDPEDESRTDAHEQAAAGRAGKAAVEHSTDDADPAEAAADHDEAEDDPDGGKAAGQDESAAAEEGEAADAEPHDDPEIEDDDADDTPARGEMEEDGADTGEGEAEAGEAAAAGKAEEEGQGETGDAEATKSGRSGEEWRRDILDKSGAALEGKARTRAGAGKITDVPLPPDTPEDEAAQADEAGAEGTAGEADPPAETGTEAAEASDKKPMGLGAAKELVSGGSREAREFARWVTANQQDVVRAARAAQTAAGAPVSAPLDRGVTEALAAAQQLLGLSRVTPLDVLAHLPALQAVVEAAGAVPARIGEPQRPTLSPQLQEAVGICTKRSDRLGYFAGAAGFTEGETAEMSGRTSETKISSRLAGTGYDLRPKEEKPAKPKKDPDAHSRGRGRPKGSGTQK